MGRTLLITGTDTEVGKTTLTLALASYWFRHRSPSVGILKLLACGPSDLDTYRHYLPLPTESLLCPQHFAAPLAPPLAAALEGQRVDLSLMWQALQTLRSQHEQVFVEAVGGLGCPLTGDYTVADLALDWRVPILLVAPVRLGVVGQLVVHVRYARQLGLQLIGVVLSQTTPLTPEETANLAPPDLIRNLCACPLLGVLPYISTWDQETLIKAAQGLELEYLN